ncbi:hypothetical protein STENM223S_00424 [Streptomyces tendae]
MPPAVGRVAVVAVVCAGCLRRLCGWVGVGACGGLCGFGCGVGDACGACAGGWVWCLRRLCGFGGGAPSALGSVGGAGPGRGCPSSERRGIGRPQKRTGVDAPTAAGGHPHPVPSPPYAGAGRHRPAALSRRSRVRVAIPRRSFRRTRLRRRGCGRPPRRRSCGQSCRWGGTGGRSGTRQRRATRLPAPAPTPGHRTTPGSRTTPGPPADTGPRHPLRRPHPRRVPGPRRPAASQGQRQDTGRLTPPAPGPGGRRGAAPASGVGGNAAGAPSRSPPPASRRSRCGAGRRSGGRPRSAAPTGAGTSR